MTYEISNSILKMRIYPLPAMHSLLVTLYVMEYLIGIRGIFTYFVPSLLKLPCKQNIKVFFIKSAVCSVQGTQLNSKKLKMQKFSKIKSNFLSGTCRIFKICILWALWPYIILPKMILFETDYDVRYHNLQGGITLPFKLRFNFWCERGSPPSANFMARNTKIMF